MSLFQSLTAVQTKIKIQKKLSVFLNPFKKNLFSDLDKLKKRITPK